MPLKSAENHPWFRAVSSQGIHVSDEVDITNLRPLDGALTYWAWPLFFLFFVFFNLLLNIYRVVWLIQSYGNMFLAWVRAATINFIEIWGWVQANMEGEFLFYIPCVDKGEVFMIQGFHLLLMVIHWKKKRWKCLKKDKKKRGRSIPEQDINEILCF